MPEMGVIIALLGVMTGCMVAVTIGLVVVGWEARRTLREVRMTLRDVHVLTRRAHRVTGQVEDIVAHASQIILTVLRPVEWLTDWAQTVFGRWHSNGAGAGSRHGQARAWQHRRMEQ